MIQAHLHGKIPSDIQNSEDVLTSTVFGLLQYMSTPEFLFRVLSSSINLNREPLNLAFDLNANVRYFFWPRLSKCEPDILIVVEVDKEKHLFGIETKYFSEKSSIEDNTMDLNDRQNYQRDQLAREIEDLYQQSTYCHLAIEETEIKSRTMVYITLENYLPFDELEDTMISVKTHNKCPFDISQLYWLSWKSFYPLLIQHNPVNVQDRRMIGDLSCFFEKRNLKGFTGFLINPAKPNQWVYEPLDSKRIEWKLDAVPHCVWNYKGGKQV